MSGHSKWHNIQAKKGKADAARGDPAQRRVRDKTPPPDGDSPHSAYPEP